MKQKFKISNIFSITVLILIQIQSLDLSDYLLYDYPNLKEFRLFILQYLKKKTIKMYILVIFFHCLEIKQIKKNLIEISSFELSNEKII